MLRQLEKSFRNSGTCTPGCHILVAVSGGADSTALLHGLHSLASSLDIRLTAAHLNHGLRGAEADADAAHVASLCGRLGIPLVSGRANVRRRARNRGISIEMAARDARYDFLARTARRCGAGLLATGHTADDQAETVLLKLARGAGPAGLSGIPPVGRARGFPVIRPLLNLRRATLVRYLRKHRITWREDASNAGDAFLRNRVRHTILPAIEADLNPNVREALCRTANILREENAWLDGLAAKHLADCLLPDGTLDIRKLRTLPRAARRRVIRPWLTAAGVPPEVLDYTAIQRIDRMAGSARGSAHLPLPGRWEVVRRYATLAVQVPAGDGIDAYRVRLCVPGETDLREACLRIIAQRAPGLVKQRGGRPGSFPAEATLSAAAVGRKRLFVRTWLPGDRIAPLGLKGSRKLQDVFVDAKIPADRRKAVPVIECGGEIAWLPGYRVGRGWEVTDPSLPAIHLRIENM